MINRLLRIMLFALAFAVFTPKPARADETPPTNAATATAAKKLPPGFERVAGAPKEEQLDPNPLVIGAYAMFFVMMFGYIIYVSRSQAEIAREMIELAKRIARAEKK